MHKLQLRATALLSLMICLVLAPQAFGATAPSGVTLTFNNTNGTVTIAAIVDPTATSHRFEIVRDSQKSDVSKFVARKDRNSSQATFGVSQLPVLTGGDTYIGRVSSTDNGTVFTVPAFSAQTITPPGGGQTAPVANAGPDQVVTLGVIVTLNGSGSMDPNGDPLTFTWMQLEGVTVTLNGASTANPTFSSALPVPAGTYKFRLRVSDGTEFGEDAVTIAVTVFPVDAGPDQQVMGGQLVTLSATGTTGTWSQKSGTPVALASSTQKVTTFTAPQFDAANLANNNLVFEWLDNQNGGLPVNDAVKVTVVSYTLFGHPNDSGTAVQLSSTAANGDLNLAIFRSLNLGQTFAILPGSQGQVAAFTDADAAVVKGSTLQYRLVHNGNVVSATISVLVTDAPVLASLVLTPTIGGFEVGINTPNADVMKAQWRIRKTGEANFSAFTDVTPFADFIIGKLDEGVSYDVEVRAVDNGGLEGPALSATATTLSSGAINPALRRHRNRRQWYKLHPRDCFITTAAVQISGVIPEVDAERIADLQYFRDSILRKYQLGRGFIAWYYQEGPRAARWLNEHPSLKPFSRVMINIPGATVARLSLGEMPPLGDLIWTMFLAFLASISLCLGLRRFRRRLLQLVPIRRS